MKHYTIGIQGIKGSFHHQVAKEYFGGKIEYVACDRFREIAQKTKDSSIDFGIMALENSIAGTLLSNYLLIVSFDLEIIGEYYLPINHNLMALPGTTIDTLKEVHSHRIAIEQCEIFFSKYPQIKLVEATDTAIVAQKISEENLKGIGAIASQNAADLYGLNILSKNIQTIKNNQTRFAVVGHRSHTQKKNIDKVSAYITLKHESGSLYALLKILKEHDIDITKLQSVPLIQSPWNYAFIIDFKIETYAEYISLMQKITRASESVKVLGEYTSQIHSK